MRETVLLISGAGKVKLEEGCLAILDPMRLARRVRAEASGGI